MTSSFQLTHLDTSKGKDAPSVFVKVLFSAGKNAAKKNIYKRITYGFRFVNHE